MFKRKKGIHLSYCEQGWIYFTCMNYKRLPKETKEKIDSLCFAVAGSDNAALFEAVTNENKTLDRIASDHYISRKRLEMYRKEFYEKFAKY